MASSNRPTLPLIDGIENGMVEWPARSGNFFLPISKLEELMEPANVIAELERNFPKLTRADLRNKSERIIRCAKRLFAVLVYNDEQDAILDLLGEDVTDEDLPLMRIGRTESWGPSMQDLKIWRSRHAQCHERDDCDCSIQRLEKWKKRTAAELCRTQWMVLAPVFKRKEELPDLIPHLELDDSCLLPFTEDREKYDKKAGGYSEVWGVRIHPAHQKLLPEDSMNPFFAVKRLYTTDVEFIQNERQMLVDLTGNNHPHLIKLLATWEKDRRYHMLFQFADANLQTYWDANTPHWNCETWLWAITQMKGLSSGLEMIHNFKIRRPLRPDIFHSTVTSRRPQFSGVLQANAEEEKFGRHGDLKPENILFFRRSDLNDQLDILQIADFGLSRFHRLESRSIVDPRVNGSPTYSPPEIYLGKFVSRAYDIWSMGCVYLQFITWLLEGPVGLTDFTNARMERNDVDLIEDDVFYTQLLFDNVKEAKIRSGVDLWIDLLRKSPACSDFIGHMLDLVQDRMLLISAKDRIHAEGLNSTLREILIRAQNDSIYLLGRDAPVMATEVLQNGKTITRRAFEGVWPYSKEGAASSSPSAIVSSGADDAAKLI